MTQLHILGGGAAAGLVRRCAPAFEQRHGAQIHGTFGAVGAMKTQLLQGAACDVLILTQALIDELVAQGEARAETVTPVGLVMTGIAVQENQPAPDVHNAEALRQALLAASAVYFPDPQLATAGIHFMKVMQSLGVVEALASRLKPYPNGATAMKAMADSGDPHAIGCTQVTEILITPGVRWVANLPPGHELATRYTAAVTQRSASSTLAHTFIHELVSPSRAADRDAAGFLPLD